MHGKGLRSLYCVVHKTLDMQYVEPETGTASDNPTCRGLARLRRQTLFYRLFGFLGQVGQFYLRDRLGDAFGKVIYVLEVFDDLRLDAVEGE